MIATDAGLDIAHVREGSTLKAYWNSILWEATQRNKLDELRTVTTTEYSNHKILSDAWANYLKDANETSASSQNTLKDILASLNVWQIFWTAIIVGGVASGIASSNNMEINDILQEVQRVTFEDNTSPYLTVLNNQGYTVKWPGYYNGGQSLQMEIDLNRSGIHNGDGFNLRLDYLSDIILVSAFVLSKSDNHPTEVLYVQLVADTDAGEQINSSVTRLKDEHWTPVLLSIDNRLPPLAVVTELRVVFYVLQGNYTGTVHVDDIAIYKLAEPQQQPTPPPTPEPILP